MSERDDHHFLDVLDQRLGEVLTTLKDMGQWPDTPGVITDRLERAVESIEAGRDDIRSASRMLRRTPNS